MNVNFEDSHAMDAAAGTSMAPPSLQLELIQEDVYGAKKKRGQVVILKKKKKSGAQNRKILLVTKARERREVELGATMVRKEEAGRGTRESAGDENMEFQIQEVNVQQDSMEEVVQQPGAVDEVQIPVLREDSTVGMEIQPVEWFAVENTTLFDRPRVGHANLMTFLSAHDFQKWSEVTKRPQFPWLCRKDDGQTLSKYFRFVCLAFSSASMTSKFVEGYRMESKYVSTSAAEHALSKEHTNSSQAMMIVRRGADARSIISGQTEIHKAQNRQILSAVLDVLKLVIGQGLALRGHRNEGISIALTDSDSGARMGNFTAIFQLICARDQSLSDLLEARTRGETASGRTKLTFTGHSSIMLLIDALSHHVRESVLREIRAAGIFGLECDSSMDVSV